MKITRKWAMPSADTFDVPAIGELKLDFETLDDSLELRNLSFREKRAVINLMERYAREKSVAELYLLRKEAEAGKLLETLKPYGVDLYPGSNGVWCVVLQDWNFAHFEDMDKTAALQAAYAAARAEKDQA